MRERERDSEGRGLPVVASRQYTDSSPVHLFQTRAGDLQLARVPDRLGFRCRVYRVSASQVKTSGAYSQTTLRRTESQLSS